METKNNLTITEMLSKAFYLCKDNFWEILKVIGIYIIPSIIILIIALISLFSGLVISIMFSAATSYENIIPSSIGIGSVLLIIPITFVIALISGFGSLVIGKILDEANKENKITWKEASKYIWDKKWSALGLNIIIFFMLFAFFILLTLLTALILLITFGIGAIIMIPLIIALIFIVAPFTSLINSIFIVRDLSITESIGEAFSLFKKGEFWKNIGILASIAGISLGAGLVLYVLQLIPLLGFFIGILGQSLIGAYVFAYLNVFTLNKTDKVSEFNL